ncbi:MAG: hypothetical protein F6K08_35290 [Okeania sp. SIO1H6]|nr:hypothetical protein [Okeania sp. SIO1H6]
MLFPIEKGEQIDEKLIQRTLSPYSNKGTIYLQEARRVFKVGDSICSDVNSDKKYLVMGQFSIGESCYIDDTGHLNAVEFNICYNQLLYVAIAWGCDQQKLDCFQELTL